MNRLPEISVVTAVYNGADYIDALIESVLAQDYPHFEHIIIDDGSTDNGATVAVLKKYPHLKWWSRENKGQYATQNEGLDHAKGDIICIISADDVFVMPDTFHKIAEMWQAKRDCDLIYGRTGFMDSSGNPLPFQEINGNYPKKLIHSYLFVQHCSLFVSAKLVQQHNIRFNPQLKYAGDWDWIIRLFDAAQCIYYLPVFCSTVRIHPEQTSRRSSMEHIKKEHQYILFTYNGYYVIYRLLKMFLTWRARLHIGVHILKKDGLIVFLGKVSEWVRRTIRII